MEPHPTSVRFYENPVRLTDLRRFWPHELRHVKAFGDRKWILAFAQRAPYLAFASTH